MKKITFILGVMLWSNLSVAALGIYTGLPQYLFSPSWIAVESCNVSIDELKKNTQVAPTFNKCLEEISASKEKMSSLGFDVVEDRSCEIERYNYDIRTSKKCDVAIRGSISYSK